MKLIRVPPLTPMQSRELNRLDRITKDPGLRTHAQIILLSTKQGLKVTHIPAIVRESQAMVFPQIRRYLAERLEGLQDAPRPVRFGHPSSPAWRA